MLAMLCSNGHQVQNHTTLSALDTDASAGASGFHKFNAISSSKVPRTAYLVNARLAALGS